jgi:Beta-propeller repeat
MLSYSTYLDPSARGMAVNSSGEACIKTFFLSKLRSNGSVIYSIPATGAGADLVAIDTQGNCYVTGHGTITPSTTAFQRVPKTLVGRGSSQFIEKFDGNGNLVYATYLGGSQVDVAFGMAVNSIGNVYVTGYTNSNDFPTLHAFQSTLASTQDAFIAVLNATGTALLYSTYWGGSNDNEVGMSIAIDTSGKAYIAGTTGSSDFPLVAPFQSTLVGGSDAFVIKLDPTGQPIFSTFLGASAGSFSAGIAADESGSAYVTGVATTGFALANPIQSSTTGQSAFVSKFTPDGSALTYSTYLGNATGPIGIAVDSTGQAYIAGTVEQDTEPPAHIAGRGVPLQSPIQSALFPSGNEDGYVSVIDPTGTKLVFSSYLGGDHDELNGFGVDASGNVYVSGITYGVIPITNAFNGTDVPIYVGNGCPIGFVCQPIQPFALKISLSSGPSFSYPTTLDLRPVPQPVGNSSSAIPVLIANTSASVGVGISNIAIQGDFSETNNCSDAVAPATSCELQVIFTPTAGGQRSGTISVIDTAPGSPHLINLIGTGLVPTVQLTPTSLTFPAQAVNTISTGQTINLNNTGGATLAISNINATGDFTESNGCGGGVPAMATCKITVVFSPTATGNRTGTLTIVDDAAGSPHTVSLEGTGVTNLGLGVAADGSGTATVSAGASASYKLTIGGTGMGGNASLSCTGAPAEATCSVPATQNVNANTQATFTANITTTPQKMGALQWPGAENAGWFSATAVMAGLILVPIGRRKRTGRRTSLFALRALSLLIVLTCSCGGGSGHQTPHGTPAGTYNLMVTARMGSDSQSTMLTLIVQ